MNFLKRIEKLLGINDNKKKKKKENAKPKTTPLKRNVVKTSSKTTPLNRTTTTKSTPLKRNTIKSTPLNIQRDNKYVSSVGSKDRKSSDIVKNYKENKGNRTLKEATKDIKSTGKAVGYVGKKTGQGILGGATGIATAGTSEVRNQYQKGEKSKKSNASILLDIAKGTMELGRPEQQTQKVIKAIIKNVDKASKTKGNIRKKAINFLLDSTQDATDIGLNKDYVDKYLQFQGKNYKNLTGKSLSKKVEKLEDTINKPYEKNAEKLYKEAQNYNKGTQFAGDVLETVGRMGIPIAVSAITKKPTLGRATMAVSAKGSSTREALNKGATLDEANKIGTAKGLVEYGTELISGGLPIMGKGALDDIAEKGIQKTLSKVGGQSVKRALLDKGLHGLYDVLGENLEEWITDVVDTQIDKATVDPKAKYTLADWGQTTALTTASTIVLNLLTKNMVGGVRVDMNKAINQTENQLNTKFTDKEKNILKDNALKDLMYKNAYDKAQDRIQENKKLINNKIKEAMTLNQNKTMSTNEVQRQKINDAIDIRVGEISQLKAQNQFLQNQLDNNPNLRDVGLNNESVRYKSNDSRLASIEQAIPSEMYETPLNIRAIEQTQFDNDLRVANLLVSARQNLNNSEASQSFVKMLSNLAENKGYNIVFNPDMGENINGRIVTNENAKTIELNPNSDKSATFVLMHELSHDIGTQEISEDINNFRGENVLFDEWYKNREQLYREQTNLSEEEIQEEMMCDSIGELLGNEEYINHLTTKPTLMQKIMDWINKFLGRTEKGSQEYNYLQQLKRDFERAYNRNQTTKTGNSVEQNVEIEYNINGNLDKYKSSDLYNDIFQNYKPNIEEKVITNDYNNYYEVLKTEDNDYEIISKIPITEKNKAYIDMIVKEYDNYANSDGKINNSNIERTEYGEEYSDRNNATITKQETMSEFIDRILKNNEQAETNKDNSVGESERDSTTQWIDEIVKDYNMDLENNNIKESKELESSFSLEENYRGSHQIENAKAITELDINDIYNKVQEIDGYITKQSESDFRKLKKILKSDEKVKIYRASPVNELNSGDWVTTDKAYAQNVANNNGGKVYTYEVDTNQLYYPDNISDLPSLHRLSSFQYNGETQENNTIKNSTELSTKDSRGKILSKEQQEYFKDSKIRDSKGRLLRVYHGTDNGNFNTFKEDTVGSNLAPAFGEGFYFDSQKNTSKAYTGRDGFENIKTVYLNIKNPYYASDSEAFTLHKQDLINQGYDGVSVYGHEFVAFYPNQIKNIDNTNPTTNDDIRYSQNLNEEEVNKLAKELDELDPEVMAQAFLEKEGDRLKDVAKESGYNLNDKQIKQLYRQNVSKTDIGTLKRIVLEAMENRNYEIDRIAKITKNKNIKILGDHINNMQGEIETNLNTAQIDGEGNVIGESLSDIFAPYTKAKEDVAFNDYLFHRSNIERHKNGVGSQVPMEDSQQLVKAYEEKYPTFKKGAEKVNNYNRNLLKRQVESGLISQETADNITSKYEFYVPFYENQYLDDNYVPSDKVELKSGNTLRRAQGGADANLLLFQDAMAKQTQQAISNINKNELYKEIVNTLPKKAIDVMENVNPDEFNALVKEGKKHYLTAFENGTPVQVEISQELFNELNKTFENQLKSGEHAMRVVWKPIQKLNDIKRNLVTTWSPSFVVTNALKDIQDAYLNTKYTKDFAKAYPTAMKEMVTGKDTSGNLQKFLNMYGKPNIMGDYSLEGVDADVSNLMKNGKVNNSALVKIAKKIPQINEVIEMIPRYTEYLASLENGCSQKEALYNAREVTVNFGRGGYFAKALNRNGMTFFNAQIQGFSKFFRNFHDAPVRTTAKATAYGLTVALINQLMHGDDDDYDLLPDYIKDNYYLFKVSSNEELKAMPKDLKEKYLIKKGKATFIRIPRGRMLSIFSSMINRGKDRAQGKRGELNLEEDIKSWFTNATNQVGLPDIGSSNLFAPFIDSAKNKTWYGGQLVPDRLLKKDGKKLPATQQYDASTDKISIWLGQKTGISPYKINYILDQYTGGIGDMLIPLITEEAQSSSNGALGMALAPLKDKFTADTINDNKNVTNFYSKAEKLGEKSNELNATGRDKLKSGYMDNVSYQMGALYKQIRDVQADKNLSKKEKYERYEVLKSQINELAKNGLENVNKVKGDEYYGEVEENGKTKQLFRSAKGNYYELYDNQKEALDNANLSVKERNNLYKTKDEISKYLKSSTDKNKYSKRYAIIKDSNNSQSAKAVLYNQNKQFYQKDPTPLVKDNLVDSFLDIESQNIKSDYKNGKIVYNSKRNKIAKAINKLNLSAKDKQKLYDFYYPSKTKDSSSGVGSKGSKRRSGGSKKAPTKGSKRTTITKTPKITRTKVTPVKLSNKSVKLTPVKAKSTSNNKYYQEALKNLLFKKTK